MFTEVKKKKKPWFFNNGAMYGRRTSPTFLHPSISAPALGQVPWTFPSRIWYNRRSSDSPSDERSGASSPTTSLLLYMWGYDEAHAPTRTAVPGGYPGLLTSTSEALQRRRLSSDAYVFRRTTALVFGLAVVTCFAGLVLTAGSRFRTGTAIGEHSGNSTRPVLSAEEERSLLSFLRPMDEVEAGAVGSALQGSASGVGVLVPGTNGAQPTGEKHRQDTAGGSSALYALGSPPVQRHAPATTTRPLGIPGEGKSTRREHAVRLYR
ncbi:hypothetical protein V5799_026671 [Amblyomma americanum]|uniref:Transmembrane protein n=1 Tax=Amblyomma americanum TaxID=6943 RepID=A0AAQ4DHX4_AMBAM